MAAKSTKSAGSLKPYDGFPLTAHRAVNQWCKKHRGTVYYFGTLDDWQSALEEYERTWPYVITGRTPPPITADGCTLRDLCNAFIVHKQEQVDDGELSLHTYSEYYRTCQTALDHLGEDRIVDDLRPDDFREFRRVLAKGCGPVTLQSKINRCRVLFKYASDNELVERPVAYGKLFDRPSAKAIRQARNEAGERMFEPNELRRIINAATQPLEAMILLGLNCGFGNTDIATLPKSAVDLDAGWVEFPRPKTQVRRRCPLWPETVESLRKALAKRPPTKDPADADLCFLTTRRTRFVRVQPSKTSKGKHVTINALANRFNALTKELGINGRKGLGFYTLRHVFQTIGGESKDPDAVSSIMGHETGGMADRYRERISDERLRDVVNTVRRWLWLKRK